MIRDHVEFILNGRKIRVGGASVFQPLSTYLREERRLTGTKVVCAEGDCGACTVMIARADGEYTSVNSCIAMTFLLDGANLVTVEGLREDSELCEIQKSMVRNFGGQCGFCTPGFVMALTDLYECKDKPTEKHVKNFLTGNLCRCTGYQPIITAALDVDFAKHKRLSSRFPVQATAGGEVRIEADGKMFFSPVDVKSACQFKADHPDVVIFSGSTDLGVRFNKGHIRPTKFMSLNLIPSLYDCSVSGGEVHVGAKASVGQFIRVIEKDIPRLAEFMHIFASPQIKNSATVIGNVANGSPIADTTPTLMALDAVLDLAGVGGTRQVAVKDFYLGYKKMDLKADEIITGLRFKVPAKNCVGGHYKVSQRRDLDISGVNASFAFDMDGETVKSARIAYGGVAATTVRLIDVEKLVAGKKVSAQMISETKKAIAQSIKPISDARGSAEFRTLMAQNLFEKYIGENFDL